MSYYKFLIFVFTFLREKIHRNSRLQNVHIFCLQYFIYLICCDFVKINYKVIRIPERLYVLNAIIMSTNKNWYVLYK